MRITYRSRHIKDYWIERWENLPGDKPIENLNSYPIKYADQIIQAKDGPILELGCGMRRILRYYHNRGCQIWGWKHLSVENMPLIYKFYLFRAADHKNFDEHKARVEGYQLSGTGKIIQNLLMRFFPNQFCNIYVLIAKRT